MHVSKLLLIIATTLLVCGNSLSMTTDSDRATASRLLPTAQTDESVNLRELTTIWSTNGNLDEERARFNFGSLTKLIPVSPANKAAKVAKAAKLAEQKQKLTQMYTKLLERDDFLYDAMAVWRKEGTSATSIYHDMKAVGKTIDEAETIFKRYSNYLQEMAAAGRPK